MVACAEAKFGVVGWSRGGLHYEPLRNREGARDQAAAGAGGGRGW